jgi:hypothetical protein
LWYDWVKALAQSRATNVVLILLTLLVSQVTHASAEDRSAAHFHLLPEYRFLSFDDSASAIQPLVEASANWQKRKGPGVNHGYQKHPLWLRFDVDRTWLVVSGSD